MTQHRAALDWIASQQGAMLELTKSWSAINSGSTHLEGLERMMQALKRAFAALGGEMAEVSLEPRLVVDSKGIPQEKPLGKALHIRKHEQAPLKILFVGHMDTVFGKDHPFQVPEMIDAQTLRGPGVADLKGGLAVMLHALLALEKSEHAGKIGWEIVLNPDEEIGSPGSMAVLADAASRCQLGLVYEPALEDGTLAGERKGSGNFVAVMHGKAAHAGRDFASGRNAVVALAEFIRDLHRLNGQYPGITVNPAIIEGGEAVNQVPDLAICRFNVRVATTAEQEWVEEQLATLLSLYQERKGYYLDIHGTFGRPPKGLSRANELLFTMVRDCGEKLGQRIQWKPTGGCCDGNNLAAFGLPNVDTLGVRGGKLHTADEYMMVESLAERAQLSALLLLRLASGELQWTLR